MSATLTELRAVRIACDVFLKDELLKEIKHLGPSGYTWWEAQGTCPPQSDSGFVGELPRVFIEVWCSLEVAEKILTHCDPSHFPSVGIVAGITSFLVSDEAAAKLVKT
jgi:hypothetical protein